MDIFHKCFKYRESTVVKEMGIYPYFHALESEQDAEVFMDGKRRIMIGSNNYLGLTNHPRVKEAGIHAIKQYGSGVSGSRFLNGTLNMHIELEEELASFLGKEAALTFSTGFQSNLGIISGVASRNDLIFCDRENHASIYDGIRLSYAKMIRYRHNDMEDLENRLKKADPDKGKIIITDGVFSMTGNIANIPELVRLKKKYNARLMVDDAHGFGVLGAHGKGTAEHFGLLDEVDIIMSTFSKSLASLGGFMVADEKVVEYVKHKSRPFIFSAAITPANTATALEALRILKEEPNRPKRLLELSNFMKNKLIEYDLPLNSESITPIIPIYTYSMKRTLLAVKELYDRGVYVNPVFPPATPVGECLIRTSFMASHTEELLEEAATIIYEVLCNLPMDDNEIEALIADE